MRYLHPQADAIERAFAMAHGKVARKRLPKSEGEKKQAGSEIGTELGTIEERGENRALAAGQTAPKAALDKAFEWCREGESNPQDPKVGGF